MSVYQVKKHLLDVLEPLRSLNPVLALSGGTDSWFLFRLLKENKIPFRPISLTFEKENYGEEELVKSYADVNAKEIHFIRISKRQMLEAFYRFSHRLKIPIYNLHAVSKWVLAEQCKELGFSHVVSGDGADQWFERINPCDLLPITQRCFRHVSVELWTPFTQDFFWGHSLAKKLMQKELLSQIPHFSPSKNVRLYPDDDFLPLTCQEKSLRLIKGFSSCVG